MKMKSMFVVALAAGMALAGVAGPKTMADAPKKSLKVLMIGNSFSICLLEQFPQVAKSMGLKLDLCSLYIGGCSFERHWKNVEKAGDPNYQPYDVGWNYGGVAKDPNAPVAKRVHEAQRKHWKTGASYTAKNAGNIPEFLKADTWDVVTIQQASHFSWQPDTFRPFADNLVKTIRELAPQAQIVVQETWSYTPWDGRLKTWGIDQNEMYAKLHAAYGDYAAANGFMMIPVGTAVQNYRKDLPVKYTENSFGGDPCGSAKFEQGKDGKWVPKGDVFHFNREGHYLQALTWTATLFGVDVAKCPYKPTFLAADRAEKMKSAAMKAAKGEM